MNRRRLRKYVLYLASSLILTAAGFSLTLLCGEAVFAVTNGTFYFLSDKHGAAANDGDMAPYREIFDIKKSKRTRITAVGGSTTYGFGINSADTWPRRLAVMLEQKEPGKYEVINLGRIGGHMEEFLQDYERSSMVFIPRDKWIDGVRPAKHELSIWGWKDLKPDIVIVAPIVNDTAPDLLRTAKKGVLAKTAAFLNAYLEHGFIYDKLAFGFYLKDAFVSFEHDVQLVSPYDESEIAAIKNSYRRNLSAFINLWRNDSKVYLLGFPLLFNPEEGEREAAYAARYWGLPNSESIENEVRYLPLIEKIEKKVRNEVAAETGVAHKELGGNIKRMRFQDRIRLYEDSIHMNRDGVKMLSEEIFKTIP